MSYRPITDVWILARPKVKYYGAYPAGFLHRARALLGVSAHSAVLHVCAGRVKDYPFAGLGRNDKTLDIDPAADPDFLQDARQPFPKNPDQYAPFGLWSAVLIDPPYTVEDAAHYGAHPLPSPNELLRLGLEAVSAFGGRVGMLHYVWPQPPKNAKEVAVIAVGTGRNNRARWFTVFERIT